MDIQGQQIDDRQTLDFMLAEYEMLRSAMSELVSHGENRVNFFLAIVSGAMVGLAFLNQSSALGGILPALTGTILIGLLLLGLITFARTVDRDVGIKTYARGMNRIRRYFTTLNPNISDYLTLPITDDFPLLKPTGFPPRNLCGMMIVVNGVITSISVLMFAKAVIVLSVETTGLLGFAAFLLTYFIQYRYYAARLREAEKKATIRFPSIKQ
jgi:hypothetical protein